LAIYKHGQGVEPGSAVKQLQIAAGFVRVLEILESPGILFWHFPGLESPGKLMQVLESPENL